MTASGTIRIALDQALRIAALAFSLIMLWGCGTDLKNTAPAAASGLANAGTSVALRRTAYGVVHVKADDYGGLGYGAGYAYATDNFCLLAEQIMTVNGERSKYFGPSGTAMIGDKEAQNLTADLFYKYYLDDTFLSARYQTLSSAVKAMLAGYAAGYNRYLNEVADRRRSEACADSAWLRPALPLDIYKIYEDKMIMASGGLFARAMVAARADAMSDAASISAMEITPLPSRLGSNGWAFGSAATVNNRGLLVANPHFPWTTTNRFYQLHLTIPGELDVMGASLAGIPPINIGFNKDAAWTHTVSTARRFTLFELLINKDDPTSYIYDGQTRPMREKTVTVAVLNNDGALQTKTHTFYETVHGPVIDLKEAGLGWTRQRAFALGDANKGNTDALETSLEMNKAQSVPDIVSSLKAYRGLGFTTTLAADRAGNSLFADIGRTPNAPDSLIETCAPSPFAQSLFESSFLIVLDGTSKACNWTSSDEPYLPAEALPLNINEPYFLNSNDSYWVVSKDTRNTKLARIMGPREAPLGMRTRMSIAEVEGALSTDETLIRHASIESMKGMLFSNRNYVAIKELDKFLTVCDGLKAFRIEDQDIELGSVCDVLTNWDRTNRVGSRGAVLFREFWKYAAGLENLYAVKFDMADPANTPRELNISDEAVREGLWHALAKAVLALRHNGLQIDVSLGEVQYIANGKTRIPIPGGSDREGVLNLIGVGGLADAKYEIEDGSSYIQLVTFDDDGPVAEGILSYAQSTNPASPYYLDQTQLFSDGRLYRFPFHEAEIRGDAAYSVIELMETE